ncbi:MAG: hypothetical protein AAB320_09050 [Elusimicrobiota bacterium]
MFCRLLAAVLLAFAGSASAANLDVSAAYKMRALSYKNLNFIDNAKFKNEHSFIGNDARLGLAVRKIALESRRGEEVSMDVGIGLHALGVAGSTTALQSPFDRAANAYPSANLTPFIENAYVKVHQLLGYPVEATFGRQTFKLASGLLLDDDGAGLTGINLRGKLPWWGMKLDAFVFQDRNPLYNAENTLGLFGFSLELPSEGNWQLSQLFERDRAIQPVYGCTFPGMTTDNCMISKANRSFSSLRYQLNYGPMVFDGEAAMQKGAATPTGINPAHNHITYNGNAQVIRAKWKQKLYKAGEGIARASIARGTGDKPDTQTTDEAFYPSHGHRFNGLERSGFGEFFAATPYDAFGGNYSSTTASGLAQGASGIMVVGAGYSPPAYHGFILDIDYYLYQAERVKSGPRTLGTEWDLRVRYAVLDQLTLALSSAFFTTGTASNPTKSHARKYALEVSGRF